MFKTIRTIAIAVLLLAMLAGGTWGAIQWRNAQKDKIIYLALAGPLSGSNQAYGAEMQRGVELYLKEVNAQGGINGKRVELLTFDDQNNSDLVKTRAQEVVNSQAVIVIGHAYSSTSLVAGEIYKEQGPAAISGSATSDNVTDNPWYFRSVANNRSQAVLLGNYISQILKIETAGIIFDQDQYGTSLASAFESAFAESGGTLLFKAGFDNTSADLENRLGEIVNSLAAPGNDKPGIIFLAVHKKEAVPLLAKLREKRPDYPIICSEAMGDASFSREFAAYPQEQEVTGYFTNAVYTVTPILYPIAGKRALQLEEASFKTYNIAPGWKTATYYDAAMLAVEAIRRAGDRLEGESLAAYRVRVRDQLAGINSLGNAVKGVTGDLYFDQHRDVSVPMIISVFQNHYLLSAMEQVQQVKNIKLVEDLPAEVAQGSILNFGSRYFYRTNVIYTGLDFVEISNLDTKNATFTADFYIWLRYRGELDISKIEFVNAVNPIKFGNPVSKNTRDGVTYEVYRIKSNFKADFDYSDYPFDRQDLQIRIRHASATRDRLIFMPDVVGMRYESSEAAIKKLEQTDALKGISSWPLDAVSHFQDVLRYDSTLGNPENFGSDTEVEYSGYTAELSVHRDVLRFGIKNFVPLFLLILISYMSFFFPPSQLSQRFSLGTGPLLTTAFFHNSLINGLPQIGYVVAMEYVFYGIYTLYLVIIITSFICYVANESGKKELAKDLNWVGGFLFEAIILIGLILLDHYYVIIR